MKKKVPGTINITYPGYFKSKDYYRRSNVAPELNLDNKDYSTSLYWNPDISITDEPFRFEVITADLPGRHCLYIQGLTEDGIPFVGRKYFTVE